MNYRIIIGSTTYYAKDIEANSSEEAFTQAHDSLKSGEFTEWKTAEFDSSIYDILEMT